MSTKNFVEGHKSGARHHETLMFRYKLTKVSKEYDIDNAISYAIIYEIDSSVTPLLMLWGQLTQIETMSRFTNKAIEL